MDIKNKDYYLIKISEFLDGELSPEETRDLFNQIANNTDLQEELKTSMAVRNMFHQELLPPPKQSKIMLYGKLNLQKSAVIISLLLSLFTYFRRILLNPAVGATLVGIGIFLLGYFTAEYAKNQNTSTAQNSIVSSSISNTENELIPIVKSQEIDNNQTTFVKLNKTKKFNRPNDSSISDLSLNTQVKTNNQDIITQNEGGLALNNFENYDRQINPTIFAKNNQNINYNTKKGNLTEIDYLITSFLDKMSIGISKSNSTSNIKNNLEPLSNPMLNDYSVAVGYSLNENNIIAIEFGQENYPQRYTGVINQNEAVINQVYTAQWYGLSYQYNFDKISDKVLINPFVKILSSLTKIGPFFKGSLGMNYSVNDKLILNIGLESSTLLYEFQGKNFNTTKYGLFYGAKINF